MVLLMLLSRYNVILKRQDMVFFPSHSDPQYFNSNDCILVKDG